MEYKIIKLHNGDDLISGVTRYNPDDDTILLPLDRVVTMTSVKSDLLSYYIKLSEKHKLSEHSTFEEADIEEGYEDDDEDYLSKLESASNNTIH